MSLCLYHFYPEIVTEEDAIGDPGSPFLLNRGNEMNHPRHKATKDTLSNWLLFSLLGWGGFIEDRDGAAPTVRTRPEGEPWLGRKFLDLGAYRGGCGATTSGGREKIILIVQRPKPCEVTDSVFSPCQSPITNHQSPQDMV
ncbi:MAG: hypothetical protein RLZZ338_3571 [Cyanobacteriota bacterium]